MKAYQDQARLGGPLGEAQITTIILHKEEMMDQWNMRPLTKIGQVDQKRILFGGQTKMTRNNGTFKKKIVFELFRFMDLCMLFSCILMASKFY